jgi:threonine dehydrogenase-like Zn-dependent dehydrogenase
MSVMQALTFRGIETVCYESVPDPAIRLPTDAILQVRLTAICGSDLHVYRGREVGLDVGTVLGHEFVGEVVAVGPEVRSLEPGVVVVAPFTTSCGVCFYCRRGLTARCEQGELFGWVEAGGGLHGAQAEAVRVPLADSTLVEVPEGTKEEAALFAGDILSTGFYCAEMGGVGPGRTVAILGCGPVGLMAVLVSRELGAETVLAVDAVVERLELAGRFGARPLDMREVDVVEAVLEATEGRGVDTVLEVVGSPEATRLAVEMIRPGGVISAAGVHTEAHFTFSPGEAYDKNLTYRAGRCPVRGYMERALRLAASKGDELSSVITHRLALSEGPRAYRLFDRKEDGCIKVVLRPGEQAEEVDSAKVRGRAVKKEL